MIFDRDVSRMKQLKQHHGFLKQSETLVGLWAIFGANLNDFTGFSVQWLGQFLWENSWLAQGVKTCFLIRLTTGFVLAHCLTH